jgi:hypothetical protein
MSMVDKERIAAAATLKALGYLFPSLNVWSAPNSVRIHCATETDVMYAALMRRADALEGTERSPEQVALLTIADVREAYEAMRGPQGNEPDGNR